MIYKTIIIDDEKLALERLERLLTGYKDDIEIIGLAGDGFEAVTLINSLKPDLIFLDIQMPELTGFEVIEKLKHIPLIIFSTAYDEYSLQAFETNSIDYLLKPIKKKRLSKAINKLKNLTKSNINIYNEQIQTLINNMNLRSKKRKINVRNGDEIIFIDLEDIYYFKSDEQYTQVNTYDKQYLINDTLNELEKSLSENFARIHRSIIVNIDFVTKLNKHFLGKYNAVLKDKNKTEVPVSRNFKNKLLI